MLQLSVEAHGRVKIEAHGRVKIGESDYLHGVDSSPLLRPCPELCPEPAIQGWLVLARQLVAVAPAHQGLHGFNERWHYPVQLPMSLMFYELGHLNILNHTCGCMALRHACGYML